MGLPWKCSNYDHWVGWGSTSPVSNWALVKCPQDSQWGPSTEGTLSSGSRKVTCLSNLCWLRDLSHLSRDLPQQWLQLWLWLWGCPCLDAVHFLTQSVNVQLQHMGSLQCPAVSLPGLPEDFIKLVVSPSGLGVGFWLVAGLQSGCSSLSLTLLQHGSALSPL